MDTASAEPQSTTDAAADQHAQTLNVLLTEAAELGISDQEIAAGAHAAMVDLQRQAAMQIAQGMKPVSTLALILQLKGLLGVIKWRRGHVPRGGAADGRHEDT